MILIQCNMDLARGFQATPGRDWQDGACPWGFPSHSHRGTGQPQGDSCAGDVEATLGLSAPPQQAPWLVCSGPPGARGHLPLALPLELIMGTVQVLQHLQQAGSGCFLPGQSFWAGPWGDMRVTVS